MNATALQQAKVDRVVAFMAQYKNIRLEQDMTCERLSLQKLRITRNDLHAHWPRIEKNLNRDFGLFCIRPIRQLGWRMVATDMPQLALVQQAVRDKYRATEAERDLNDRAGNMQSIADGGNARWAVRATRVMDRDSMWLQWNQMIEADLDAVLGAAVAEFTALPYAFWDGAAIMVQPVGPNGLPDGSPYSLNGHH